MATESTVAAATVKPTQAVAPKKANTKKDLVAKFPPFIIQPTGQVVGDTAAPVEVDGWVQANIDAGLLRIVE